MSDKVPYVKVAATFYLKEPPDGYLGLRSKSWTFGNEPVTFGCLAMAFVYNLLKFYIAVLRTPTDELNVDLGVLADTIRGLKVEEASGGDDEDS